MSDPIFGIFGPSAQEKMRAQTLQLAQSARNPFVMRNIMREGAAIINGDRTTPQYQADVARDNARNNILNEAQNAGIDIAKDPVGFADSAINTMMTQKYPGYERDVFLMNQWKQIQQANKQGADLKTATTAATYGKSDFTPESLAKFKQSGDPGDLVRDPNANKQSRSEYYTPIQTAKGVYTYNNRTGQILDPATGKPVSGPIVGSASDPTLQGDISGAKEMGGLGGKNLDAQHKQALDAANSMRVNQQAMQLLNEGMTTGKFADFKVGFAAALQSAGINIAKDPTENAQAYAAMMGQQVATVIKAFGSGTGLSDADRAYAEKIAGGQITLNEGSIRKILEMNNKANQYLIDRYQKLYQEYQSKYMPPGYKPPEVPASQQPADSGLPDGWSVKVK